MNKQKLREEIDKYTVNHRVKSKKMTLIQFCKKSKINKDVLYGILRRGTAQKKNIDRLEKVL